MGKLSGSSNKIFNVNAADFNDSALSLFEHQAEYNPVYSQFLHLLGINLSKVTKPASIPFLPVEFFKTKTVKTGQFTPEAVFYSSGTTSRSRAKHYIKELSLYEASAYHCFKQFYDDPRNMAILALLPSYLENPNASLIHMVDYFIRISRFQESGFFRDDTGHLVDTLQKLRAKQAPVLLIGVSYALLDLAEEHPMDLSDAVIMETGGMKGRRREMVREELHERLRSAFNVDRIHSEYGMTELMSQAYAKKDGLFQVPPWMKVLIRDPYDPFNVDDAGKGAVNIIDLANRYSCAFIATQDLGEKFEDGTFRVLGRFDNSDLRGCNLMVG